MTPRLSCLVRLVVDDGLRACRAARQRPSAPIGTASVSPVSTAGRSQQLSWQSFGLPKPAAPSACRAAHRLRGLAPAPSAARLHGESEDPDGSRQRRGRVLVGSRASRRISLHHEQWCMICNTPPGVPPNKPCHKAVWRMSGLSYASLLKGNRAASSWHILHGAHQLDRPPIFAFPITCTAAACARGSAHSGMSSHVALELDSEERPLCAGTAPGGGNGATRMDGHGIDAALVERTDLTRCQRVISVTTRDASW